MAHRPVGVLDLGVEKIASGPLASKVDTRHQD